jgi:PQQ-like domain
MGPGRALPDLALPDLLPELWSFTTGSEVFSSPAVANGVVYIGSFDDNVYAFGLDGGTAAVKRPTPAHLHPNFVLRPQDRKPA